MKPVFPLLMVCWLACMTHGPAIAEEVTRVFLFAGQSNMVGADAHADRIDDYPNFTENGLRGVHHKVLFSSDTLRRIRNVERVQRMQGDDEWEQESKHSSSPCIRWTLVCL